MLTRNPFCGYTIGMTTTEATINIQIYHPMDGAPVGGAHIVPAYPGGHSNTALCGAPIIGRLHVVRTSTCAQCARTPR